MAQLHCSVPQELADRIRREAQASGMSVSRYLAELVTRALASDWPAGYFEAIVGGWQGEPLERPPHGEFEPREPLDLGDHSGQSA